MSTVISIVLALALAGAAAWLVRRYESARGTAQSECSRLLGTVFAGGQNDTPDSLLLERVMVHRDACLDNAEYVDQARRLMTNTQQFQEARTLLEQANARHAFKAEEMSAQMALVDVAESQSAWANGQEGRARELLERATSAANALRAEWPEWSLPYRILEETSRSAASGTNYGEGTDYFRMERTVRSRKLNGAWLRGMSDWQPVAVTFAVAAIGLLAFAAGLSGFIDAREITRHSTAQIGTAQPGYVELKGTLHTLRGANPVIGPHTKSPAVWYEMERNSGAKRAVTEREQSAQPFVLRDASGEVIVNPKLMSVRTKHSTTRFGNSAGQQNGSRLTERLLKEGDVAFALGALSIRTAPNGESIKHLAVAEDGRRLLVANYSESELVSMERLWFALGTTIFVVAMLLLGWAYYQRYAVTAIPGTLS